MAILFGNTRFWAVFANVLDTDHMGNRAVVYASQPLSQEIGSLVGGFPRCESCGWARNHIRRKYELPS